uniref:Replication factor A C-terminal domain-containing protein n=1 Tax=Tanacetum cinerariifolium TaxID=118510 RepID=A0A699JSK4_TANCI|nr:hypothetical protein [Tanacetum cinerariifolium]GFA55052.1 hypothetical protein [Tanacetum cinerariifolium]
MSRKATSAKISISSEATSPDNHMSAVDRRVNITSDGGTSSNKATLDESASAKEVKSDSPLFLDELQVGVAETIFVMLCRTWDVSAVTGQYLSTDMVDYDERKQHIPDVVGYIANVGRSIQQRAGSRTLDFYLANERSSTQIFDDPNIPALKELMSDIRPSRLCQWTLVSHGRALLKTSCYGRVTAEMKTWNGWNFLMCGEENCKKGVGRKLGGWWCDTHEKVVECPILRYMLELGISDATLHVVVVMFDETVSELVKCSANSLA